MTRTPHVACALLVSACFSPATSDLNDDGNQDATLVDGNPVEKPWCDSVEGHIGTYRFEELIGNNAYADGPDVLPAITTSDATVIADAPCGSAIAWNETAAIDLGDSPQWNRIRSIDFWFYMQPEAPAGSQLVSKEAVGVSDFYIRHQTSGDPTSYRLLLIRLAGCAIDIDIPVITPAWHHVSVALTANELLASFDGNQYSESCTASFPDNNYQFRIGRGCTVGGCNWHNYADGRIDHLRFSDQPHNFSDLFQQWCPGGFSRCEFGGNSP